MAPVRGMREINRAFIQAGARFHKDKEIHLRAAARPVARDAETLAQASIRKIGVPWSQMRVGSTPVSLYVAPVQRGSRVPMRKRRNLARLLLNRAMVPALNRNRSKIANQIDELLARMERAFNRG